MAALPNPLPPEADLWWLLAPIGDVLEARIALWKAELAHKPTSGKPQ